MNIVITGSTRGIGFAAARQLLRKGHAVTLCSEDEGDVATERWPHSNKKG